MDFVLQFYFVPNEIWGQNPWQAAYSHSSHCIPLGYGQLLGSVEQDQLVISPSEVTLPWSGSELTEDLPDPVFTAHLHATGCPALQQNWSLGRQELHFLAGV